MRVLSACSDSSTEMDEEETEPNEEAEPTLALDDHLSGKKMSLYFMDYVIKCDNGAKILQAKGGICLILVMLIKTAHSQSPVVVL